MVNPEELTKKQKLELTVVKARLQDIRLIYKSPLLSHILTMNSCYLKSVSSKETCMSALELKSELGRGKDEDVG